MFLPCCRGLSHPQRVPAAPHHVADILRLDLSYTSCSFKLLLFLCDPVCLELQQAMGLGLAEVGAAVAPGPCLLCCQGGGNLNHGLPSLLTWRELQQVTPSGQESRPGFFPFQLTFQTTVLFLRPRAEESAHGPSVLSLPTVLPCVTWFCTPSSLGSGCRVQSALSSVGGAALQRASVQCPLQTRGQHPPPSPSWTQHKREEKSLNKDLLPSPPFKTLSY